MPTVYNQHLTYRLSAKYKNPVDPTQKTCYYNIITMYRYLL